MTTSFYPPHLRSLFTDRERELDLLQQATAGLAGGHPRHLALFGLRRIGKTLLMLEHATRLLEKSPQGPVRPVYVNFEELVTSPELFSRRYVGLVTFWALTQGRGEIEDFLTPTALLSGPAAGLRTVAQTMGAMESARDDPATQVTVAMDFPEKLAEELDCRLLLLLDEFTELGVLSNYPSVRRPLHLFRAAMQRHGRLGYVIAASAISAMGKLVQDGRSPLFLQFEPVEISRFPPDATLALAERVMGSTPAPGVGRRLHQLSGGHPFYIHVVADRLANLECAPADIGVDDVSRVFVLETLSRTGRIYNYCRYLYDVSLQRARGYGILKAILQVMAEEEELTLSELARRIHKKAPTTRGYLRALQEVMQAYRPVRDPSLPRFFGGAVGYIGYDWIARIEPHVPLSEGEDLGWPDMVFLVTDTLVIFDHVRHAIRIVANAHVGDMAPERAYERAAQRIEEIYERLTAPTASRLAEVPAEQASEVEFSSNMSPEAFMGAVGAALLGAAIWGGIAYLTGYEVGYVAWGIGFIVGFGAKALGAKGHTAGVICAGLALLSIFTGKMFTLRMVVGNEVEKAARQHLTQEVYRTVQRDAADFALVESEDAYPAFMASHGYSKSQNPAEVTKKELVEFKRASAPRLREFQKEQPDFHAWRRAAVDAAMAEISLPGLLRDSLHPFDLLFAFLGIVTAFRVVTVKREVPPPEPAAAE